jgi:ABC-type sugar transport system, periplasmic component
MKKIAILVIAFLLCASMVLFGACKNMVTTGKEGVTETSQVAGETSTSKTADQAVETTQVANNGSKGVVYYFDPTLLNDWMAYVNNKMLEFGKQSGYEVKSLDATNSADTQLKQISDVLPLKPAAIILNAVDSATITAGVQEANDAGVPVLVFDRFITEAKTNFTSAVGTIKIGQLAANECAARLKEKNGEEKGLILELMGDAGDSYTVTIDKGFSEEMKSKYPNIKIIAKDTPGWELTKAGSIVEDQITTNANIDLIFVHSDGQAMGFYQILESNGHKKGDIILVGTDGTPDGLKLIRDGWMVESIGVPLNEQIWGIWQYMDKVIAKEKIDAGIVDIKEIKAEIIDEKWGTTLYLPGSIITKDNVDDPNLWGNNMGK